MLEEITGKHFKTLHIVGGGSRNELLNRLAAEATGMRVVAGPVEATALGNILTQAIAMGDVESIAAGREVGGAVDWLRASNKMKFKIRISHRGHREHGGKSEFITL